MRHIQRSAGLGLGISLLLAACAPKAKPPEGPATDLPQPLAPATPLELGTGPRSLRDGTVSREAVVRVLAAGPAMFLRAHDVAPVSSGGALVGWRLLRFFPAREDSPLADLDLLPGDVLLTVNGAVVERPEQFMAVWESLYTASEIRAQLARDRELIEIRYRILDASAEVPGGVDGAPPAVTTPAAAPLSAKSPQ